MLPRAEAPVRRLPYTTADMSERLAKRKAEQDAAAQAKANQALRFGVTNPPVQEDKGGGGGWWPSWKELGNAGKMGLGTVAGAVNTVVATPLDIADEAVQGLEKVMGITPTDKFDPASIGSYNAFGETYRGVDRAANYVAGQIAATPGVGKPSSSPFMDTVRSRGWAEAFAEPVVHAVNVGSVAYPASKMAVGAKLPGTIADTYRQRLLERDIAAQNNLFPAVQRPANVIDIDALQGSRLPARVVDSPATPATRLGNALAQKKLDARAAQGGVRDAGILRMPGSYPAGERYVFDYNQSDPGYVIDKQSTNAISRSYDKVGPGEKFIDTKGTETGVPGRSYTSNKMVALQSPQGNATLGYDIETRVINGTPQPRIVLKPISSAVGTPTQVKQLLDFLYGRYKNAVIDWGNISTELPNELFYEYNNRFPVRTVGESVGNPLENFNAPKTNINVLLDTPQRGAIPYTELYDAIGVLDNNRIYPTSEFKQLMQKFGLQGREREVLDAFARREGIVEPSRLSPWQKFVNEMQRQIDMGDYFDENPLPSPATRLAEAQGQRALPPAEIAPAIAETPASRLTPPAFRERPVPASSRLTVEFAGGKNPDGTPNLTAGQDIIIRSYNQKTGEYTGAITISYDPFTKQATVNGLGATSPTVTPQLISAAAAEVRKLVGDVKYPLTPDTSLSPTSRPFVERLQQAGLIDPEYKLPAIDNINTITKLMGPASFAPKKAGKGATVIDPLSYQPTYNDVLKALVESKRQAKLAGEYGRLTTPSSNLTRERVAELTERELAENATAHLKTILEPVETLQSTEFPLLNPRSYQDWGLPKLDSEVKQTLSFPVYEIGGEKIAFGNPGLGRFNPEFNAQNVQIIPVDPYRISGLDKTSTGGQHYAKLMFDAHQGLVFEQGGAKNIGQVSALTYAASRGDNVAFNELERLASVGQKMLTEERLKATQQILAENKKWEEPNYWNSIKDVRVKTGQKDADGFPIYRPMGIDDMFLVHQTDYAPTFDANGNIILKPFGDYPNTDKATGQQMIDEVTGKPSANIDRDTLHFSINHLVGGNYARPAPTSNSNVIIIPLRDVLNANPGSLDNLYAIDTFLTPKPGEGLVIPMQNGKVLYQGQFQPGEFNDAVNETINQIGKMHNRSADYQAKIIEGGGHYSGTPNVDKRISQVGIQDIAREYPEYGGGVIGSIHENHPSKRLEEFDIFDAESGRGYINQQNYWRLSPNARLRIYDSNTSKYTTGELNQIYPDYFGF